MPSLGERLPLGDNAARVVKTGDAGAPLRLPPASPLFPLHRPRLRLSLLSHLPHLSYLSHYSP